MSVITPFDPWKTSYCTCPRKYSLSPYTGCSHGCLYCYASSYIKNFHSPRPKNNFLKKLAGELKKINPCSTITLANSSDPYLPLEKKHRLTLRALELIKKTGQKVIIVTKSSLVLRDLAVLRELPRAVVSISLTTLRADLAKKLEGGAPSPEERLAAVEILAKYLPVAVRFDPLIYPLNTNEIKSAIKKIKACGAKQIITSTYKAKPDSLKRMVKVFPGQRKLWENFYLTRGTLYKRYFYLPLLFRKKLIEEVKRISLAEGLAFSSCREGFADLNTLACDGSSLSGN